MTQPGGTKVRVIAALTMAPIAIAAILLLPTPWLAALAARRLRRRAVAADARMTSGEAAHV